MILPVILSTVKGKILLGVAGLLTTLAVSEVIVGQLIAAVPPTAAVIVTLIVLRTGQKKNAAALDGKLDAFMDAKVEAGRLAGKEEERVEARAREGEAAIAQQAAPHAPAPVIAENTPERNAI